MEETSKEVFAKNLTHYMKRKGKTQKELAEIVGVSAPTVNEWIKAKKYPRIDKIEILAQYFGIRKSDLIEERRKKKQVHNSKGEARLGDIIRSLRIEKNITLAEFSEELGIPVEELRKYENGSKQPPAKDINSMASLLGTNPIEMIQMLIYSSTDDKDIDLPQTYIKQIKRWHSAFSYGEFSKEEQDMLFHYAQYLVWKRDN